MSLPAEKDKFLSLILANKGILYKVSYSYCKDAEDRKDLVQETVIQLWKSFHTYDESYKLSTWMYRVALNVAISFYRKERRRKDSALPISGSILEMAEEPSPGELENNIGLLQKFISELNELDKALMLLYMEESSYREIAEVIGITETNVATKISRIKEKLKQKFKNL